jgi:hypothetical protein
MSKRPKRSDVAQALTKKVKEPLLEEKETEEQHLKREKKEKKEKKKSKREREGYIRKKDRIEVVIPKEF